jgi:hypothetical protein
MLFNPGWLTMHFAEFWIIGDSAARRDRSQPGRQALRPAACEIIKAEDAQNSWICVPVRPTLSMGNQRAYSALGVALPGLFLLTVRDRPWDSGWAYSSALCTLVVMHK